MNDFGVTAGQYNNKFILTNNQNLAPQLYDITYDNTTKNIKLIFDGDMVILQSSTTGVFSPAQNIGFSIKTFE